MYTFTALIDTWSSIQFRKISNSLIKTNRFHSRIQFNRNKPGQLINIIQLFSELFLVQLVNFISSWMDKSLVFRLSLISNRRKNYMKWFYAFYSIVCVWNAFISIHFNSESVLFTIRLQYNKFELSLQFKSKKLSR